MTYNTINLNFEDSIALIEINRPKALNALSSEVLVELNQAIDAVSNSESTRVLIITGSGEKSFVAGADISEMKDKNAIEGQKFSKLGNDVFAKLEALAVPVIAAVNGFALGGGCELALACDIRIAAENAVFGQPEVGLGITPGFGGTQRLARTVGMGIAKELVYTGRNIKADYALSIGLVNSVVEAGTVVEAAKKMASRIAGNAPYAVQASKRAMTNGIELDLNRALDLEAEVFGLCFATNDQKEGMEAFLEKRKPTFNNN